MEFIESQRQIYPDLALQYEVFGNYFENKLWHQLSMALEVFLSDISNRRDNNFVNLYNDFISNFESRLDQVKLVTLFSLISSTFVNASDALVFLEKRLEARERLGAEASLCLDMDVVITKVRLGLLDDLKLKLEQAKERLASVKSSESVAFSKYYRAAAEYRKVAGPPQEFYAAALMYLSFTPVEDLSIEERYVLATDMALAAICGEEIYNFGEVIATPILSALSGTPNAWLYETVMALHVGDIDQFNVVVDTYREQYAAQPALAGRHEMVKQKVVLLCLVNLVFERPAHDRQISFADIAQKTRIPLDQVEWVLMRAMSLGLVRGAVDEVDGAVNVTWVQPRVLDKRQLAMLCDQLGGWGERVKSVLVTVEDHTPHL